MRNKDANGVESVFRWGIKPNVSFKNKSTIRRFLTKKIIAMQP